MFILYLFAVIKITWAQLNPCEYNFYYVISLSEKVITKMIAENKNG